MHTLAFSHYYGYGMKLLAKWDILATGNEVRPPRSPLSDWKSTSKAYSVSARHHNALHRGVPTLHIGFVQASCLLQLFDAVE